MKPAVPDAGAPAASRDAGEANRIKNVGRALDSIWGMSPNGPLGLTAVTTSGGGLHIETAKMPMDALAQVLASYLRAPVIDMTGLEGKYQVTLDFSLADTTGVARAMEASAPGGDATGMASDPQGTSMFSAVQRLGLRLERRKAPVALLVVDRLERVPTEN
jgi:uncharacterized protein (TIGR03435 family)